MTFISNYSNRLFELACANDQSRISCFSSESNPSTSFEEYIGRFERCSEISKEEFPRVCVITAIYIQRVEEGGAVVFNKLSMHRFFSATFSLAARTYTKVFDANRYARIAGLAEDELNFLIDCSLTTAPLHKLFATSFLLATKVHLDDHYNNKLMAKVAGVSLPQFNQMETNFLLALEFNLNVSLKEFNNYQENFKEVSLDRNPPAHLRGGL